jgi:hypothetical protein
MFLLLLALLMTPLMPLRVYAQSPDTDRETLIRQEMEKIDEELKKIDELGIDDDETLIVPQFTRPGIGFTLGPLEKAHFIKLHTLLYLYEYSEEQRQESLAEYLRRMRDQSDMFKDWFRARRSELAIQRDRLVFELESMEQEPLSDPIERVVGEWDWFTGRTLTINADHTMAGTTNSGTWSYEGADVYVFTWEKGGYVDTLTWSPGPPPRLEGTNNNDTSVWGEKK